MQEGNTMTPIKRSRADIARLYLDLLACDRRKVDQLEKHHVVLATREGVAAEEIADRLNMPVDRVRQILGESPL
jgi:hypothetical protein